MNQIPPCAENPDLWFSEKQSDRKTALAVCNSCPLRKECLEQAIANKEEFGIWGGTTEAERADAFSYSPFKALLCLICKNNTPGTFEQIGTQTNQGARWTNPLIQCGGCGNQFTITQKRWDRQGAKAA